MKLEDLKDPGELKSLSVEELEELAADARRIMVRTVTENGGHLAPNLGVVELTLSLYHVFDFSKDKIIFDVGHQCYMHKLITGRSGAFSTLRQPGGLSGFPRREESPYDLFNTGHSSSALSLAAGLARARDLKSEDHCIVCVVGDGALTGGMAYEALNDLGNKRTRIIIVLNDNGMSISGNVGALSNYLTYLRLSKGWQKVKGNISKLLLKVPVCGKKLHDVFLSIKDHLRNIFINDKFFSCLGLRYIGPVDGHDIKRLSMVLKKAQRLNEPVLIHVMTKKGKGHEEAENKPEDYHNIPPAGQKAVKANGQIACEHLMRLSEQNPAVAVVTAAMTRGTGFAPFKDRFPERLFDVGIAEEHAVGLAAGLARGGMRPYVAVYDTFLQRSFDQIMEDVCCQGLPVMILSDRAEFAAQDGLTHQGLYGNSYFRAIPGLDIFSPLCADELRQMLTWSLAAEKPAVFRYPKAFEAGVRISEFKPGKWHCLAEGTDAAVIALGNMAGEALRASELLSKDGVMVRVIGADSVRPLDEESLDCCLQRFPCFTVEENQISGGFGSAVAEYACRRGLCPPKVLALPDAFFSHGDRERFLDTYGLSARGIAHAVMEGLKK